MKPKLLYSSVSCATFILGAVLFVLWYFPGLTFHAVEFADGAGTWSEKYVSIYGIAVTTSMVGYPSEADARKAFEDEARRAETIIERARNPAAHPDVDEEIVGMFANTEGVIRVSIIRLKKKDMYRVDASSLRYALEFEKYLKRQK